MKLKPYQEEGRDFLAANRYALLADEMRLGKTGQAITAAAKVGAEHILVVCPAIATTMWEKAIDVWWPRKERMLPHFIVVSYDRVRQNPEWFTKGFWDLLVLDESHYLKSITAQRTKAVLGKGGVARHAHRVWALSGTPMVNHAGDIWPLMFTFGATSMKYEEFLYRFCNVDQAGRVHGSKKRTRPQLQQMMAKVMKRRLKKDVAPELPACTVTPYYVKPDTSFLDVAWPLNHEKRLEEARAQNEELKQVLLRAKPNKVLEYLDAHAEELATLRRVTALLKAPALVDLLQFELDSGILTKCVVFGFHREALKTSCYVMKNRGYRVDMLYGGTPKRKRDAMLGRFERPVRRGGTQVLFANLIAAGTAIDLAAAHEGFLIEKDWVPGNNAQALERMGGYRQTHPVIVRDLILPGSADELVGRVVNRKAADLANIHNEEM